MFRFFFWTFITIVFNTSCINIEKKKIDGIDSCEIVKVIINSKKVKIHSKGIDSLFIIKSKVVNNSWPTYTSNSKIFYIKEEKDVSVIDFSPNNFFDKRFKIAIPIFKIDKYIAHVSLIIYYKKKHYECKFRLKYIKNKWVIF